MHAGRAVTEGASFIPPIGQTAGNAMPLMGTVGITELLLGTARQVKQEGPKHLCDRNWTTWHYTVKLKIK